MNQLQDYCPTRALRSGDQNILSVKKTRIKIGDSSFTVATSVLWNALPCQIKKARTIDCFKSMIINISLSYKLCHHELLFCTLYHIHIISALNMLYYLDIALYRYILLLLSWCECFSMGIIQHARGWIAAKYCTYCIDIFLPPEMGSQIPFLDMLAVVLQMLLLTNAGDVETNPGPTTSNT